MVKNPVPSGFRDAEVKKIFLDLGLRSYLTEVLLISPEKANLDDCKAIVTLAIAGDSSPPPPWLVISFDAIFVLL